MSALAQLPADQAAVLDLVLRRGRSYAGIARALHLEVDAVRIRARDAVSALGAYARIVPAQRRAQVTDWLLGQAEPDVAADVVAYLSRSPVGRAWARSAVAQLGPLAGERLPELPVAERAPLPPAAGLAAVAVPALLVFAVAIVVGSRDDRLRLAADAPPAPPSAWLAAARPGSDADGAAEVLRRGRMESLVVTAGGLPRSTDTVAYTVWLTRGGRSGATHVATLRTDANGSIDGLAPLQVDPGRYREVLVSRQRVTGRPTSPGMVVLRGPLR
jgi:hypothetical protein